MESTFESYDAVDRSFDFYKTIPVTLKLLCEYNINGAWTGIKTVAFVFNKLYLERYLIKADFNSCLENSRGGKAATCRILDIVGQMAGVWRMWKQSQSQMRSTSVSQSSLERCRG